jgi:hypothetical protein
MPDKQLGLVFGESLKDEGQARVEDNSGGWVDRMRGRARIMAQRDGRVTADDLRWYSALTRDPPHSPNCYGAIFRGRGWKIIGYEKSRIPSNHARRIAVWTYDPYP